MQSTTPNGRNAATNRERARRHALAAGLLAVSLTTPAHAFDTLMPGASFAAKTSSKGTMVQFVAKPAKTGPLFPLPPSDPGAVTSTLEIMDAAGDAGDDVYGLNAGEWKGLGKPAGSKGWKYKGAGTAADPCKVVLIKEKGIKAVCKSSGGGITISPPFAGDASAILSVDADRYCAAWGGTEVKNDATQIKRKGAPAPGACPMSPTPTTTPTATATPSPTDTATTPPPSGNPTATATATSTPSPSPTVRYGRTFAAGSLIIPMDTDYQNSGMLKAFGLVYKLLRSGIPVYWDIKPGKAYQSADFTADALDIKTSATITAHGYRGGPFVVDSSNAAAALPLISAWQASNVTTVHQTTSAFNGDVARQLVAAPSIAVLDDGNQTIAFSYLTAAGIPDSRGMSWSVSSPDLLTPIQVAGPTTTNHTDGALFDIHNGMPKYCNLVSSHWNVSNAVASPETVAEVRQFLNHPVHFFAECQAVDAFENLVPYGHFLTPNGFTVKGQPNQLDLFHPDSPFAQIDGAFQTVGGSEPAFALPSGDSYKASGVTILTAHGFAEGADDVWLSGYLDGACPPDQASCGDVGRVSYLGGHQYTTTVPISSHPTSQGVRLFLQSLFAGCS